jgi:hypothetical protein
MLLAKVHAQPRGQRWGLLGLQHNNPSLGGLAAWRLSFSPIEPVDQQQ